MSFELLKDEVHVWFCFPNEISSSEQLETYRSFLSSEENERCQRFLSEVDRHNYLVSHALVRSVLSKYADVKPHEWQFAQNQYGRPDIIPVSNRPPLQFNLTHTSGFCACVISHDASCGIDAEFTHRKGDLKNIAERMFSKSECQHLSELDESSVREAFFQYWTLHEAYVKALGTGLAESSRDLNFSIDNKCDDKDAVDIHFEFSPECDQTAEHWRFNLYRPTENHIAAIAIKHAHASDLTIICRATEP